MSKYFDGDKLSGYEDSPITYVYGGNLEECHKVISDLEAKLAESERQYQEYRQIVEKDIKKEIDERMRDTIKEFNFDISQLKQQLAESEKNVQIEEMLKNYGKEEIKKLHKRIDEIVERDKNIVTELNQQLADKDQDKISFAVEQLEKIKEWISDMFNGWKTNQQVNQLTVDGICLALETAGYKIDNQIKELKEKNE